MMTIDTNVLVYVQDDHDRVKQATAARVTAELFRREAPVALQCVGELQNILRRKLQAPAWLAAQEARNLLVTCPTFPATEAAALKALAAVASGRGSYWDALLIHSAAEAGCEVIFTEDRQGADRIGGVEVVSPFAPDGELSDRARELLDL